MGITVFKESFVLTKILGAGLILFANIFLFYEKGKLKLNKYAWLGVLSKLFFSIAVSVDIGISNQFNLPFILCSLFYCQPLLSFLVKK